MTAGRGHEPSPARRGSSATAIAARVLFAAGLVLYPLVVWWGLSRGSPRMAALIALGATLPIALWRWHDGGARALRGLGLLPFVTVAALGLGAVLNDGRFVLAVPCAVNAVLFAGFALTLRSGSTPMIERFARLQDPELSHEQVRWCRMWTYIWCGFFVVNGCTAAALAAWGSLSWWAAYNGGIAYAAIGALLAIEWALRRRRFHGV